MNVRKKILYIQKPAGGGSLIALYEMVRVLDKNRFEPIIFCYEQNEYTEMLSALNVKVIYLIKKDKKVSSTISSSVKKIGNPKLAQRLKRFFIDDFRMAKKLREVIIGNGIDLIHHNCDFPYIRQGILANNMRLPQVCHYRSLQPYTKPSFDCFIDRRLAKKIDSHVYISHAVKNHFNYHLGIPTKNEVVIRDIIDSSKFKKILKDASTLTKFGLTDKHIVVTCIGRILPWKGQHVFIDAVSKFIKQFPNLKALIVGPYGKGVGSEDYYQQLKQQTADYNLDEVIIFTGNQKDIPSILSISDCLVHSSVTAEPQGLVIVEALFCGVPVVVTDSGGAAELIIKNEGGLKVSPGDSDAMAIAICSILNNKSTYIDEYKAPTILNEFESQMQIQQIEGIYEKLLQIPIR